MGGRDKRYVHDGDVQLLESVSTGAWKLRTSLLPPFDNMRRQHSRVFGFGYIREQFLPKEKRKFGAYVLPILWGERFIGRVDPQFDKKEEKPLINSVHAEPGSPSGRGISTMIREAIERLSDYVGAREVAYNGPVPPAWESALR